jgi:hypothetical protein
MAAVKREAIIPKELVDELLVAATPELVLVGGQALKFWVDRYGVKLPPKLAYVSRGSIPSAQMTKRRDLSRRWRRSLRSQRRSIRRGGASGDGSRCAGPA